MEAQQASPEKDTVRDLALFESLPASLSYKWRRAIEELVVSERVYVNEMRIIMRGYIHVIPDNVRNFSRAEF
jgi:hypothetical protein